MEGNLKDIEFNWMYFRTAFIVTNATGLSRPTSQAHLHSASASRCREFLWSMMMMSWCLSRKQARAVWASLVTVHINPAFSHALQNPLHWLSSLVNTKSTWIKKAWTLLFKKKNKKMLLELSRLRSPQKTPKCFQGKYTDVSTTICWVNPFPPCNSATLLLSSLKQVLF